MWIMILIYSIIVFVNQFLFIWLRTWNIIVTAERNLSKVIISNVLIHTSWLVSIAFGVISIIEIVQELDLRYLPVIISSIVATAFGSYTAIKNKK